MKKIMLNSSIVSQIPLNGSRNKLSYNMILKKDSIIIENQDQIESNVEIPLKLEIKIEFLMNKSTLKFYGLIINFDNKNLHFLGQNKDLSDLKLKLANQVTFLEISNFYDPISNIGRGCSSKVYLAASKTTSQKFAIKCISKKYILQDGNNNSLKREIQMLDQLNSPLIISIHEVYEGNNTYYLVLDYMQGGSLKDYQQNNEQIPLDDIRIIIQNLLKALVYLHNNKIMHRDIKPENLMFKSKNDLNSLTIADFGLATFVDVSEFQFVKCGTPGYVAPEIANHDDSNQQYYKEVCDEFSVGVILYELLTNENLFQGSKWEEVYYNNKKCRINYSKFELQKDALDLLKQLLQVDPQERITAQEALKHQFFYENNKFPRIQKIGEVNDYVFVNEQSSNSNNSFENFADEEGTASSIPSIQMNLLGSFITKLKLHKRTSSSISNQFNDFQVDENLYSDDSPLKSQKLQAVTPKLMPKSSKSSQEKFGYSTKKNSIENNSEADELKI